MSLPDFNNGLHHIEMCEFAVILSTLVSYIICHLMAQLWNMFISSIHNNNNNYYYYYYHIIYKSSNRNKVHDKFGIMYFENQIRMQIRSRD